ncbi:hypothetical protein Ddye_006182 [Dipteronia dyeriana]|uniref:Uncharacterized protein n=1 Tax=Dipteronia dyeriana TaxID=168575 RepID=A0AAE0CQF5_9ROSI|nr:hypothetical protein Ddye_006182 [Dipteronia dyeriana]
MINILLDMITGPDFVISNMKLIEQPKVHITYHKVETTHSQMSNASDLKGIQMQFERARSMSPAKFSNYKNKPDCFLKMIKNQPLTTAGGGKDVRHFEFEFVSSAIQYEVGDALEVMSYFAKAKHERERLQYFASPEGREGLYQYNQKE